MRRRLFSRRTLPGWISLLVGLAWRALDYIGRVQLGFDLVKEMDGKIGALTSVVVSPFFSVALVALGLIFIASVPETRTT